MDEICNLNTYAKLFILDLGINWAMAVPAVLFKTERYFDLTGAVTNVALAVASYALSPKHSTRQLVQMIGKDFESSERVMPRNYFEVLCIGRICRRSKQQRYSRLLN